MISFRFSEFFANITYNFSHKQHNFFKIDFLSYFLM
jgi:hypothetical protein